MPPSILVITSDEPAPAFAWDASDMSVVIADRLAGFVVSLRKATR